MCGIFGFIQSEIQPEVAHASLLQMRDHLRSRGPDDSGEWCDKERGLFMGHTRLSIQDTSQQAAQPMVSSNKRYVLVYNGEIYNVRELKDQLKRHPNGEMPAGHGDTVVLLAMIEQFGVIETLPKLNGMFALGVWDTHEKTLIMARDRMGIKPLYYGVIGDPGETGIGFSSTPGALRLTNRKISDTGMSGVNLKALGSLLNYGVIQSPLSIYKGIWSLPPGHALVINYADTITFAAECDSAHAPETKQWWSTSHIYATSKITTRSFDDVTQSVETQIETAVRDRLVSDVPLGAFLSGGLDSSLVTMMMRRFIDKPMTFTIGYQNSMYDESESAELVAKHLGTEHHCLRFDTGDLLDLVQSLHVHYDEPFADSSQLPMLLLSRLACAHVKVALSGDGGDEVFCGYNRYIHAPILWHRFHAWPVWLRKLVLHQMVNRSEGFWKVLIKASGKLKSDAFKKREVMDSIGKLARLLDAGDGCEAYQALLMTDFPMPRVLKDTSVQFSLPEGDYWSDSCRLMRVSDLCGYLPNDILTKVDRASMAFGLEARTPLLDHRLIELAASLGDEHLVQSGRGKLIMRHILEREIPSEWLNRPKQGFAAPIGQWLRDELRDWAQALLTDDRLQTQGCWDLAVVKRVWKEHLSGQRDHRHLLWAMLMFQQWFDAQLTQKRDS